MAALSVEDVLEALGELRSETRAPLVEAEAAPAAAQTSPEVAPDVLAILAAAAAQFLRKNACVRSSNAPQTPCETVNLWAQQGRISIHASHNLQRPSLKQLRRE